MISQKTQYALRALFELAKRFGQGPVKVQDLAERQAIPPRFLEVILGQLKQAGFVDSRRGAEGGYLLLRQPSQLSVGEILHFLEGSLGPVGCLDASRECPLQDCAFMPMWRKVQQAMDEVYSNTSLQDLIDQAKKAKYTPSYCI